MADPQISSTPEASKKPEYVLTSSNLREGMTLSEAEKAGKELASYFQFADNKGNKDGKMSLNEKLEAQQLELRQMEAELARAKDAQKHPGQIPMRRDSFGISHPDISSLGVCTEALENKIQRARAEIRETQIEISKRQSNGSIKNELKEYSEKSGIEFKA